jgi:iron complex transport system substrate-binding protein
MFTHRRSLQPLFRAVVAAFALGCLPGALQAQPPAASEAPAPAKPMRIASTCVQGDQLLLELVPRERIVAVSQLATDPDISPNYEKARGIPQTGGGSEALALLQPELVLTSSFGPRLVGDALKQRGVRVVELGIPNDFAELRALLRTAAREVGEEARAEEIIARMDARLARLEARRPPPDQRPRAMFYFQDGFTPGARTFANALLEAAGYRNLGGQFSPGVGASAPLEAVLMARPELLILTSYREAQPAHTQNFPLQALFTRLGTHVVSVSFRNLSSPDPANLELAERLQQYLPK